MEETEIAKIVAETLAASKAQFTIVELTGLVILTLIAIVVIWKYIIEPSRFIRNGKTDFPVKKTSSELDARKANLAHELVLREDNDGIPIFLSMAKLSKDIKFELKKLNESITRLTNHNTTYLNELRNEIKSSLRKL